MFDLKKASSLFLVAAPAAIIVASTMTPQSLTSSSYAVYASNFASAALHTNSPVYEMYSSIQDSPATVTASDSFVTSVGFSKAVYFSSVLGPSILSVDPPSGYNTSKVNINKITGLNFSSGMSVKLSATGESDIVATNVNVINSSEISCDLDIAGAKAGYWNVYATKEGLSDAVLMNGFEVKSFSYSMNLAINSPNPFDPARESTTIMYRLANDANVGVYLFTITGDLMWRTDFMAGSQGGKSGENSFTWNGISSFGEMMSNGVYLLHIVDKSSGRTLAKGKIMILRRLAQKRGLGTIELALLGLMMLGGLMLGGNSNMYNIIKRMKR